MKEGYSYRILKCDTKRKLPIDVYIVRHGGYKGHFPIGVLIERDTEEIFDKKEISFSYWDSSLQYEELGKGWIYKN